MMTIWWQIKATKELFVKFHEMFGLIVWQYMNPINATNAIN